MFDHEQSNDPSFAESIVVGFLPDLNERRVALGQLLASADYARAVAPHAWSVTLLRDMFRLNVGRVEVLVVASGFIRLNCVGRPGTPPFLGEHFEEPRYRSVPNPKCAFVGPIELFSNVNADLQLSHRNFIEVVGRRRSGEPASGSPHIKSHCEGLMVYARRFLTLSEARFASPDEVPSDGPLVEGAACQVVVNAYERNPEARRLCIAAHGTCCVICGFSFGVIYGPEAEGYIHVHHIRPLSEVGGRHMVNPVEDLRPVCPNCHAVLHLGGHCRSIDQVRQLLAQQRPT